MRYLFYYRQKRVDGEIRTGISLDGVVVLESTANEVGPDDRDPVLLWFVDVRCEGKHFPKEAEEARAWLLAQSAFIRNALNTLADEMRAGVDIDIVPLRRPVPGTPRGLKMAIIFSTLNRRQAREAPNILREVAEVWEQSLRALAPLDPALY